MQGLYIFFVLVLDELEVKNLEMEVSVFCEDMVNQFNIVGYRDFQNSILD